MPKSRKRHTAEEKVIILKDNLLNKTPVSELCDQYEINPTQFYRWQKQMFENMSATLERKEKGVATQLKKENERLKKRLTQKDMVIAEIMEDYVAVKKSLGEG